MQYSPWTLVGNFWSRPWHAGLVSSWSFSEQAGRRLTYKLWWMHWDSPRAGMMRRSFFFSWSQEGSAHAEELFSGEYNRAETFCLTTLWASRLQLCLLLALPPFILQVEEIFIWRWAHQAWFEECSWKTPNVAIHYQRKSGVCSTELRKEWLMGYSPLR